MVPPRISPENIDYGLYHILPQIEQHKIAQSTDPTKYPFVLALTGLQGSGKSTWTDALASTLRNKHNYKTINISLDDLYLDHDDLITLRKTDPCNKLLQTRGQPGTHDKALSVSFFRSLDSLEILLPSFDKRWCVGFLPLAEDQVQMRWNEAGKSASDSMFPTALLKGHALEHLLEVNENLRQYHNLFMGPKHFDYLVHLDTNDLVNVYRWRIQQENALWHQKTREMTDEEVVEFVKGYMPAYELYLERLREGIFSEEGKGQLRVVLDQGREIIAIETVSSKCQRS